MNHTKKERKKWRKKITYNQCRIIRDLLFLIQERTIFLRKLIKTFFIISCVLFHRSYDIEIRTRLCISDTRNLPNTSRLYKCKLIQFRHVYYDQHCGRTFCCEFFWLRCIANVTEYICAGDGYFQGYWRHKFDPYWNFSS